jgi:HSP20 family molecular chaperone IbpA
MDAMRVIGRDQEQIEAINRARAGAEMQTLSSEYDRRIKDLETKGRADEINTQQTYRAQVEKARMEGQTELSGLQENQQRLKDQARLQEAGIQAEERKRLDHARVDNEFRYQDEQAKGMKAVSEVQTRSTKALRDSVAQGERDVLNTRDHYNAETRDAQKAAEKKIADTKAFEERTLYNIDKVAADDKRRAETTHYTQMALLRERSDSMLAGAGAQNEATRKKIDAEYIKSSQSLRAKRDTTLNFINEEASRDLAGVRARSDAQVEKAIADSAFAITSHGAKASDPFYRPHNMGTKITENERGITVEVVIPEHEKDSVRVVKNNKSITVSGNRRYEGKANLEPGHNISTNSYQSYSETFATTASLNMGGMSRTYYDGKVVIFLPKT